MFLHSALSLNLSSRGACCANQLHRAPVTSICSSLLPSTQGLTGACRRAAAPALSAKTAIFHRAVSGVTGSLSEAPHTSFSLLRLSASGWTYHETHGEQTWRLSHSATPKGYQLRMILWHLLRLDACSQSWPVKKDLWECCKCHGVNANNTAMLRTGQPQCKLCWNVLKCVDLFFLNTFWIIEYNPNCKIIC